MGRRPIILVSVGADDPFGDYWSRVFTRPLLAAGALPLILPGLDDAQSRAVALEQADGVLLGGGWDIDPQHYGEARNDLLWDLDQRRDGVELGLVREAMELGLPILGTCRGMQVINVALGGSLYLDASLHPGAEQHLSAGREGFLELVELELANDGRVADPPKHRVVFEPGSHLHHLYGDEASLNSFHHQHVRELGAGVRASGHSDDGVVEAIEVPGARAPVIGVQWEMQEGWRRDPRHFGLFERFVRAARDARMRVPSRAVAPTDAPPRLEPVENPDEQQQRLLSKTLAGPDGRPLNVFATLAHRPELLRRVNALGGYFFVAGELSAREREIVILRVASRVRSDYEVAQHRWIAAGAGLGDEEISAALGRAPGHDWSTGDRALLAFTDELLDRDSVSDPAWRCVADVRGDVAATELLVLVGYYRLLAGVLNGLRVAVDPSVLELLESATS